MTSLGSGNVDLTIDPSGHGTYMVQLESVKTSKFPPVKILCYMVCNLCNTVCDHEAIDALVAQGVMAIIASGNSGKLKDILVIQL